MSSGAKHLTFFVLAACLLLPSSASALSITWTKPPPPTFLSGVKNGANIAAAVSPTGCKGAPFPRWLYKQPGSSAFYPSYGTSAGNSLTDHFWWPGTGAGAMYAYVTCTSTTNTLLTAKTDVRSFTVVDKLPPAPAPTPIPAPKPTPKPVPTPTVPGRPTLPIPVLEAAKRQLTDPCDSKALGDDPIAYVDNCTQAKAKANQVAQTGPAMICTLQTFIGPGFVLRRGFLGKAKSCITQYGPWARKSAAGPSGRGPYRGLATPLASGDRVPSKGQVVTAARALALNVLRHKRPTGASRVSLGIARKGRSATFAGKVRVSCSNGGRVTIGLKDLAGTSDDLAVKGGTRFSRTADDGLSVIHVSGRFFDARRRIRHRHLAAGIVHVSLADLRRGRCAGTFAFAARR